MPCVSSFIPESIFRPSPTRLRTRISLIAARPLLSIESANASSIKSASGPRSVRKLTGRNPSADWDGLFGTLKLTIAKHPVYLPSSVVVPFLVVKPGSWSFTGTFGEYGGKDQNLVYHCFSIEF